MKVRKITWKAKNGEPLVTYELGTHDLVINAYKTDAEQAHELMNALRKRLSPLASSTLIIAANIPDVDGACYLHSADVAFALRRGWIETPIDDM